jgi:hypothetical protein
MKIIMFDKYLKKVKQLNKYNSKQTKQDDIIDKINLL